MNRNSGKFKKIKIIIRTLRYGNPYRIHFFSVYLLSVVGVILSLIPAYVMKPLTDNVFVPRVNTPIAERMRLLSMFVLLLLIVRLSQVVISSIRDYRKKWLTERIGADIRHAAYSHLQSLSVRFYNSEKAGNLQSRICHDTQYLPFFIVSDLSDLVIYLVMCCGIGVILFYLNPKLALLLLMPAPFLIILSRVFGGKMMSSYRAVYHKMGVLSSCVFRAITGIMTIKTNTSESQELAKFEKANRDVSMKKIQISKIGIFYSPLRSLIIFSSGIMIYWVGGKSVIMQTLTLGDLLVFIGYMWQFYSPMESIGAMYETFQNAAAAGERVFKVFDNEPEIYDRADAISLPSIRGAIQFNNVTFSYDGEKNVLYGVNFEVNAGEVIGITGPSGAGKSTLAYLICRLYDVSEGSILIDGQDIRNLKMDFLHSQIALILQNPLLFPDTIAENISYAKPEPSGREVITAAKAAGAHEFIMRLPHAYDTLVEEGGVNLSGGERQRIAIARALLKKPRIIIFDEATSALDAQNEMHIKNTILSLAGEHTVFIISHRLLMMADVIDRTLEFKGGRIYQHNKGAQRTGAISV